MNATQAKRAALVAMVLAGGSAVIREVRATGQFPSVATPIGAFAAGIMLTGLADVAPALAGALASLVIITALLVSTDVFAAVANLTNRNPA